MKEPIYKRKWFIALMIFIAIGLVGAAMDDGEPREKTEVTLEDQVKELAEKGMMRSEDRVTGVEIEGDTTILHIFSESAGTKDSQIYSMKDDIRRSMKELTHIEELERVEYRFSIDLVDDRANKVREEVFIFPLTSEDVKETNWDGMLANNIDRLTDNYWVSPALQD